MPSLRSPWIDDFLRLRERVRVLGVKLFDDHLDTIYRQGLLIPRPSKTFEIRERAAARWLFEWRHARTWPSSAKTREKAGDAHDVLISYVPFRPDYVDYLLPIARHLADRGLVVAMVMPAGVCAEASQGWPANIRVIDPGRLSSSETYHEARSAYREVQYDIERLAACVRADESTAGGSHRRTGGKTDESTAGGSHRRTGGKTDESTAGGSHRRTGGETDAATTRRLHIFFKNLAWDRAVFSQVLRLTQPRLVYGLHFINKPGFLAAIEGCPAHVRPLVVMMQHGLLSRYYGFHDFKGADRVILWGESQREFMAEIETMSAPPAVVIGNPKIHRFAVHGDQRTEFGQLPRMLYLSTVASVVGDDSFDRAARIFTEAGRIATSWRPLYRPHPVEKLTTFMAIAGLTSDADIDRTPSLETRLAGVCAVVGTESTALLEAIAQGVPAIEILRANRSAGERTWEEFGIPGVTTPAELERILSHLAGDLPARAILVNKQQEHLVKVFGEHDRVPERIADYLAHLVTTRLEGVCKEGTTAEHGGLGPDG